jgi:hypothetical protein
MQVGWRDWGFYRREPEGGREALAKFLRYSYIGWLYDTHGLVGLSYGHGSPLLPA